MDTLSDCDRLCDVRERKRVSIARLILTKRMTERKNLLCFSFSVFTRERKGNEKTFFIEYNDMGFEHLANELLLDLFEYFDVIHLFRAFHRLNHRFDQLLFVRLQRYSLDFRSLSKVDFQQFCKHYFPLINNQVVSLHLSDDIETPNLPQLFLSSGYSIEQFIHLKSITIDHSYSFDLLNQITSQCLQLDFLTHLNVTIHNYDDPEENFREFMQNIWTLPKLIHCHVTILYLYPQRFFRISSISQSIKCLSLKNTSFDSDLLFDLLQRTPQLQRLSFDKFYRFNTQRSYPRISSLISLNITMECSKEWMKNLFQQFPNLSFLTIQIDHTYIDGYEWETILRNYFPKLKIFRLKMMIELSFLEDLDEQINQLLDSYRSDYWIEEHRWFVQCDWWSTKGINHALLYTLPYAFDTFHYYDDLQSKSTHFNPINSFTYHRVQTLHHTNRKRDFSINSFPSRMIFPNIRQLKVTLPCDEQFWSVIPTLDRLISLQAIFNQDFGYSQLQMLLDRAPRLYSINVSHLNKTLMNSFDLHSTSIRRVEFCQNIGYDSRYFNTIECTILAHSSLISQCKVLIIDLASHNDILHLTELMPHLQVLHMRCARNDTHHDTDSETSPTLIEWLHDHLSSRYTISIRRDPFSIDPISLWAN